MVFQNYALYPHMSVEENMAWGLKIRGMGKGHIEERVKEAARILELDGLLKRRPRELSGGVQGGGFKTAMQLLQLQTHLHAQLGVEVRERLIEQEHRRIAHDGTCHRARSGGVPVR